MSADTTIIVHVRSGSPAAIMPGGTLLTRLDGAMFRGLRLDPTEGMVADSPTAIRHTADDPTSYGVARITGAPTGSVVPWHCNVVYQRPPNGRLHVHTPLDDQGRPGGARDVDVSSVDLCGHLLQADVICLLDEDGQDLRSPATETRWRSEAAQLNAHGSSASLDLSDPLAGSRARQANLDELGSATSSRAAVLLSANLAPFSLQPRPVKTATSGWRVPTSARWLRLVTVSDLAAWQAAFNRFASVFSEEDEEPDDDQVFREAQAVLLATTTERIVILDGIP